MTVPIIPTGAETSSKGQLSLVDSLNQTDFSSRPIVDVRSWEWYEYDVFAYFFLKKRDEISRTHRKFRTIESCICIRRENPVELDYQYVFTKIFTKNGSESKRIGSYADRFEKAYRDLIRASGQAENPTMRFISIYENHKSVILVAKIELCHGGFPLCDAKNGILLADWVKLRNACISCGFMFRFVWIFLCSGGDGDDMSG